MRATLTAIVLAALTVASALEAQPAGSPQGSVTSSVVLGLTIPGTSEQRVQILLKWADIIRGRLAGNGVSGAIVLPEGEDRILLNMRAPQNLDRLKSLLNYAPNLSVRLLDAAGDLRQALRGQVPPGDELLWLADETGENKFPYLVQREIAIPGNAITLASAGYDHVVGNKPVVTIEFNLEGAQKLAELTSTHDNTTLTIVLDGKVIAATALRGPVLNGRLTVFGGYFWEAAQNLALAINTSTVAPPTIIDGQ